MLRRFEEAQAEAQAVPLGIWALSIAEQAQLTDRDNGIGTGDGCQPRAAPPPKASPSPPAPPSPSAPEIPSAPASGSGSYPPISQNSCPASAPIKGNQSSGIYHVPSGQFYGRTNPEEGFASESDAQAARYRKSQR